MHLQYPTGFGDMAAGSGLITSIALALTKKHRGGGGTLVENSLMRQSSFENLISVYWSRTVAFFHLKIPHQNTPMNCFLF